MLVKKDTKEGTVFSGKPKKVSWERLWTFSGGPFTLTGWPRKNIHTDLEFARNCGLPSVAASATQYQGYLAELMIDIFGPEWLSHGTMSVKFIKIVDAGDVIVTRADVKSKEPVNGATRFILDAYGENQRKEKVLVGLAAGIVGKVDYAKVRPKVPYPEAGGKKGAEGLPQYEPFEFLLTPELNQQYLFAAEDFHPRYFQETEIGSPIGHPGLLLNMSNATRSPSFKMGS